MITIGNGQTCLFWTDNWGAVNPAASAPELFSFVKNKSASVHSVLSTEVFSDLLHLPVSQEALVQMQNLEADLAQIALSEEKDKWSYTWGSTKFSSARIYKELMEHPVVHPAFKWLWAKPCQPKHKVSFWLLLKDRISTKNILKRKRMIIESYNCVLCSCFVEETNEHLFLSRNFAKQCWSLLGINLPDNSAFPGITSTFKTSIQSDFFMVAIILMCWSIWVTRNVLIFNGIQPSVQNCKRVFLIELRLVRYRIKQSLQSKFDLWINSLFPDF
jgi:hypothetical protein